jgi:anti-sigma factor RsiW
MTDARDFGLDLEMLSGYLDDELDARDRAAVEAQLAESAEWRSELEAVSAARFAVRSLPVREAPDGFWTAVVAGVEATEVDATPAPAIPAPAAEAEVVPIESRRPHRRLVWIASAAAAVAMVAAVVIIPQRSQVTPNVTAVVAQHGAQSSDAGDPVSSLAPVGPLAGFRR